MDNPARWVFRLTKLVAFHRTWFMADIFINVGFIKTGTSKTEFNRMIGECEGGNIDIILTKSISWFGRDTQECPEAIRKIRTVEKELFLNEIRLIKKRLAMNYLSA